ncbi:MAG: glycogen-binding domain-containing protein [Thermodesulfobacteriota bacterium]|nr:glycogen-binding domain-containing protein [Thermodesulfobacteriota bacterium]
MIKKKSGKKTKRKRTQFSFNLPDAGEVLLAGDFNQWNGKKHRMKQNSGGIWEKTLVLKPGIYEYKYIVDGKWQTDPACSRNCMNTFGSYNNWINVPENK